MTVEFFSSLIKFGVNQNMKAAKGPSIPMCPIRLRPKSSHFAGFLSIGLFRYFKIQPSTVDLRTRLSGINPANTVFYSTEPLAEVYCLQLNFKIPKLTYSDPQVKWVEQQRILERSKRDVITGEDELVQRSIQRLKRDSAVTIRDPFFKDQWYLVSESSIEFKTHRSFQNCCKLVGMLPSLRQEPRTFSKTRREERQVEFTLDKSYMSELERVFMEFFQNGVIQKDLRQYENRH